MALTSCRSRTARKYNMNAILRRVQLRGTSWTTVVQMFAKAALLMLACTGLPGKRGDCLLLDWGRSES